MPLQLRRPLVPAILAAAMLLAGTDAAHAQVVYSGERDGALITVGALGSAQALQFGDRKLIGLTGFVDADTHGRFGLEAEGRWVEWHEAANVHLETYSIGGHYHFDLSRRWRPYAKGLIGFGDFNFPYNLATGRYLVVTAGAGLDLRLSSRIYFRAVDIEYQNWPQFTYGAMTSATASSGFKIKVF